MRSAYARFRNVWHAFYGLSMLACLLTCLGTPVRMRWSHESLDGSISPLTVSIPSMCRVERRYHGCILVRFYVESDDVEVDVLVLTVVDDLVLVVDDPELVVDDVELEIDDLTSVPVSLPAR